MECLTKRKGKIRTHTKILCHLRTTQVNVAVPQAKVLINVNVVLNLEWWNSASIKNLNLGSKYLYLTGSKSLIGLAFRAMLNRTRNQNRPLRTNSLCSCKCFCINIWVKQNLGQTLAVTEVNKNQTTKVTSTPNPTSERNGLTDMLCTKLTAGMRMHAVQINSCVSGIILGVF